MEKMIIQNFFFLIFVFRRQVRLKRDHNKMVGPFESEFWSKKDGKKIKNSIINHFEAFWTFIFFTKNPKNQPSKMKINKKMQK